MTDLAQTDWTDGVPALFFQRCIACERTWYMPQDFCPGCGSNMPERRRSVGEGSVYAVCAVNRAPARLPYGNPPYWIALVDMAEGFRIMARCDSDVFIGQPVVCDFREVKGQLLPFVSGGRKDD